MAVSVTVTEVAPGVFLCAGSDVNWVLLRDGDAVTLIDSGYPGDAPAVLASLEQIGRVWADVVAVLVTHAHVDHIGGVARLLEQQSAVPVHCDPVEVAHARRERLEQAGPSDVLRNAWRPGVLPWALRISRLGATGPVGLPTASALPPAGPSGALDLPGGPVPVPTHGHTSGHSAYLLPAAGAVVTGDALVTGHAMLRRPGPQLLPPMFQHGDALAALDELERLPADLLLPGHGPAVQLPVERAVAQARARAGGR